MPTVKMPFLAPCEGDSEAWVPPLPCQFGLLLAWYVLTKSSSSNHPSSSDSLDDFLPLISLPLMFEVVIFRVWRLDSSLLPPASLPLSSARFQVFICLLLLLPTLSLLPHYSNVSVWHSLHGGWFLQAIKAMEVPVVKIRGGEAGGEEKMMIKSIVNMVQYCGCVSVWLFDTGGEMGKCCMDLNSHPLRHCGLPSLLQKLSNRDLHSNPNSSFSLLDGNRPFRHWECIFVILQHFISSFIIITDADELSAPEEHR